MPLQMPIDSVLRIDVVTLFPELIQRATQHSILGRARAAGQFLLQTVNPRDYAINRHRQVDDAPFGGGAGMVLKPEPLAQAIGFATGGAKSVPVIFLAPDGEPFTQALAQELSGEPHLVFVCGHYEGIDERVRDTCITREISLGDYVLTGGELAALVMIDATVRLLPGVLGNSESASDESFSDGLLEYPQYTRPLEFDGVCVPEVLTSGHHKNITNWRRTQALLRTRDRRPDLFERLLPLSKADQRLLDAHQNATARAERSVRVDEPVSNQAKSLEETARGASEGN
jgi:tRNA (guanine37-N1)-methyltransferase